MGANPAPAEASLREALRHHQAGRLAEAEQLYRQVLVSRPDWAEVHVNLGMCLMFRGDMAAALAACLRGVELKSDYARGHALAGDILAFQNRLDQAVACYEKALKLRPDYAEALNSLGNAFLRQGKADDATQVYRRAVAVKPDFHEAHNNLGQALLRAGRFDEAKRAFEDAVAAAPAAFAEAHNNLGCLLLRQGRPQEAENAFRRALEARPNYPQAVSNLGAALGQLDRLEEAASFCRQAVAARPDNAEAQSNLGYVLQKQGRLAEAENCFNTALALKPDFLEARQHLGVLLCEDHRPAEGFAVFQELARLKQANVPEPDPSTLPAHKLRHDEEQRTWLGAEGFHLGDGSRISGAAVNPNNKVSEISAQWRSAQPQIAVIDDLLTKEALERLRRFCLDSTIWRQIYDGGYLGALPEHGFAPPLLAQIAEELRSVYPAIIEDYPLLHFWAFKYDSALHGIKKHADFAAVNVNFWITPDEANLDPDHGGLVVWDAAAPLDWDFARYNAAEDDITSFLTANNAKAMAVPYRANRAVIFDSDLFHETDVISFKPGYENRRINVTLLFGRRQTQRKK